MPNTVITLKKSATPSAAPAALANGELAINYADGKIYYKNTAGFIVEFASGSLSSYFGTVNANSTLLVADTTNDILSIAPGNNISIVGDAVNDSVTIGLKDDVTVPGLLSITSASGDEGGEIRLANAITNSLLAGPVNIDIFRNQLRFFVAGGDARGAFINLAATSAGVGTDLLASASGTDIVARTTANAALPNVSGVSFNGNLTVTQNLTSDRVITLNNGNGENFRVGDDAWIGDTNLANALRIKGQQNASIGYVMFGPNDGKLLGRDGAGPLTYDANTIWHAGNDGASSGLDADLLDGQHGSFYGTAVDVTAAFDRANAANVLAFNTGIGANAWANSISTAGNNYTIAVGAAGNNYTNAVVAAANGWANSISATRSTASNAYATAVGAAGNNYTNAVGTAGNNFTTAVGTAGNNYAVSVSASVGTAGNNYTIAVGTAGNNYTNAVGAAANAWSNTINSFATSTFVRLTASSQTITGNLSVVGSLTIAGNTTIVNAENLRVSDPLIYLAGNNYTSDIVDIGFIGNYVNATGSNVHTGLYREHLDKMYYLFNGYDAEPINNHIGALSNNMTLAVLNADLRTSNLLLGGVNTINWITSAFAKANSTSYTSNVVISVADNTNAALRITQTGTGDAIRVEDSSNPDSTPFVVDASGNVGIGGSATTQKLTVYTNTQSVDGIGLVNPSGGAIILMPNTGSGSYSPLVSTNDQAIIAYGTTADTGNLVLGIWSSTAKGIKIQNSGNVLIGRSTSTVGQGVILDVAGAINASAVLINGTPSLANAAGITTAGGITVPGTIVLAGSPDGVRAGVLNYLGNTLIVTPNTADWKTSLRLISSNNATSPDIIIFYSNNNTSMFDARGNLLIGRTDSTVGQGVKLDVNGAVNASSLLVNGIPALPNNSGTIYNGQLTVPIFLTGSTTSDIARLRFVEFANISYIQSGTQVVGSGRPIHFTKFSSVDTTMVVDVANGNVSIGTTSSFGKFTVSATDDNRIGYFRGSTSGLRIGSVGNASYVEGVDATNGITAWQTLHLGGLGLVFNTSGSQRMFVDGNGNVAIGAMSSTNYKLEVAGSFAAQTKSFIINHPTKPDMKLRYGSLEGPENGVYVRGRVHGPYIYLPDYWKGLVDEDSITVSLTPIAKTEMPSVLSYNNEKIVLHSDSPIDCFYHVFGERKDVEKLVVEF